MNPITIPNITIPVIGLPTIGIPSVGFPSASGGGLAWPAGLKESIKAIYDPAKQGMTNYDVIEAYVEDFTVWGKNTERYTGSITNKTINITEVSKANSICVYSSPKKLSTKLYITGIADGQNIIFGNADTPNAVENIVVSGDGLYNIDSSQFSLYFGIGFGFTGSCNITITQLPTSILKDFSGNGNHAYLYGGKGKLNSGMGVYHYDFTTQWAAGSPYEKSPNKVIIYNSSTYGSGLWLNVKPLLGEVTYPSFKVRFAGLPEEGAQCKQYYGEDYKQQKIMTVYNGDNIIPEWTANVVTSDLGKVAPIEFHLKDIRNEITITQIPDYPNQLCYDGKMYAVCYGFPILTDYTVMADRTWFENKGSYAFISKRTIGNIMGNAFVFEKDDNTGTPNSLRVYSFGAESIIMPNKNNSISYQTKTKYNNQNIRYGNNKDSSMLMIGAGLYRSDQNLITELWSGCHGTIIVADRSFTEEEINWLKDNWKKI